MVNDSIELRALEDAHALLIWQLVEGNRPYLRKWFSWVDKMITLDDFTRFVGASKICNINGTDYSFLIYYESVPVGRIGIYDIDAGKKHGAIGYWLDESFTGKGIITKAARCLVNYAFNVLGLHRVDIKCGTGNFKSQAVPERLGFNVEGMIEMGEYINSRFVDFYRYSMQRDNWCSVI
jgi:ribosomal-protein-serine acetyltransferase